MLGRNAAVCAILFTAVTARGDRPPLVLYDGRVPAPRSLGMEIANVGGVTRFTAPAGSVFVGAAFAVPRDLSDRRFIEADVENVSASPARFTFWAVGGPGWPGVSTWTTSPHAARGATRPTTGPTPLGFETLPAGERRRVRLDLAGMFPGPDAMSGLIDARDVRGCELIAHPTAKVPLTFVVHSIVALDGSPTTRPSAPRVVVPDIVDGPPAPGARAWRTLPNYPGTLRHLVTLPREWRAGDKYPVIVEFTGNVFYDKFCHSTGLTEQGNLAYGLARGERFICLNLPFVSEDGTREQANGWGSVERTADYCLAAIDDCVATYGGDRPNVFYTGFSRGEIAANFVALRDDRIAGVWRAFVGCDPSVPWVVGEKGWNGSNVDFASRAARLRGRPTTRAAPDYGYGVHTDVQYLEDSPATIATRAWLRSILNGQR